ncbi:helix-turn-helix transcriptional regulator [uncultured Treponema sp.]|uniref:helix-turn-helix domain-containing protein n=1 Tax=uncultured Treponema sp. TaxID=162155 RepID=UPI0025CE2BDC|nr:helix-turn-helix transcriptional regulator [uncultured Treponema sp.]
MRLKSSPSVETAVKIAEVLNVPVEYLVTGKNLKSTEQQNSVNINKFKNTLKPSKNWNQFPKNPAILFFH